MVVVFRWLWIGCVQIMCEPPPPKIGEKKALEKKKPPAHYCK
jgi:hypothetical protein